MSFVSQTIGAVIVQSFLYGSTPSLYPRIVIAKLLTFSVGVFLLLFAICIYLIVYPDGLGHNRLTRSSDTVIIVTSMVLFLLITVVSLLHVPKEEIGGMGVLQGWLLNILIIIRGYETYGKDPLSGRPGTAALVALYICQTFVADVIMVSGWFIIPVLSSVTQGDFFLWHTRIDRFIVYTLYGIVHCGYASSQLYAGWYT
jgi:hypothetical protein